MHQFQNLSHLKSYLGTTLEISADEAHDLASYLLTGLHLLWDSGFGAYVWPKSLSIDDAYLMLEIVREDRAEFVETLPF